MRRRGFLGFMGGAAVAGPSIAKQAVAQMPSGLGSAALPGPPMGYGSIGQGVSIASDKSWAMKEIADIKRFLTGELTDEEKESRDRARLYRREQIINQNVACLASVSGSRKLAIYSRRIELHNEDLARSEQRSRLYWLLKQD